MKKLLLVVLLAMAARTNAQIQSVAQLVGYCTKSYKDVAATMEKSYWKKYEDGKMDTLNYTRWIPANITEKNAGDNVMCFYTKKDKTINYIVLQTVNVAFRNQCRAEVKKGGYQALRNESKPGEIKESYLKGQCNVTIFEGKQNPADAVSYLIGARNLK